VTGVLQWKGTGSLQRGMWREKWGAVALYKREQQERLELCLGAAYKLPVGLQGRIRALVDHGGRLPQTAWSGNSRQDLLRKTGKSLMFTGSGTYGGL